VRTYEVQGRKCACYQLLRLNWVRGVYIVAGSSNGSRSNVGVNMNLRKLSRNKND